jgi:hypothetical protein
MSDIAYHYTKVINLAGLYRDRILLPSPPLARYGLSREAVEANPGRYGFRVTRHPGRRWFFNGNIPDPTLPQGFNVAGWYEGERFAASFSKSAWCGSALDYLPADKVQKGLAYRLVMDLGGLDVFTWQDYQSRTNVPGPYRRRLGEISREKGDDPADWLFVLGPVPLGERLLGLEQYYEGRWISFNEVAERLPLKEMFQEQPDHSRPRPKFRSRFVRASTGRVRASLFGLVFGEDGMLVASHLWVRQTWEHLRPGDVVEFFATIVSYRRHDGTESYTLGDVNGLLVLGEDEIHPSIPCNVAGEPTMLPVHVLARYSHEQGAWTLTITPEGQEAIKYTLQPSEFTQVVNFLRNVKATHTADSLLTITIPGLKPTLKFTDMPYDTFLAVHDYLTRCEESFQAAKLKGFPKGQG